MRVRVLQAIGLLIAGATIGVVGLWIYFGMMAKAVLEEGQELFASAQYYYEVSEAERQFSNGNRDVSIYALERAVRNLPQFRSPKRVDCRRAAYTLAKFHVRLARLYQEGGNLGAHEEHLKKAISSYESMGWTLRSTEELTKAIPLIEAGKTSEALKVYGTIGTACDR